jgi:hypothetical protein
MKEVVYLSERNSHDTAGSKPLRLPPDDILDDPRLTVEAKRAILADWASDARVVSGSPGLRQLDSGAIVEVDTILSALSRIDGGSCFDNGDDDPPPAAAAALPVPNRGSFRAAA